MSFFDDASLAFLPSGGAGKDGKAYSIKPTDGTGDFTFSRGSNLTATRVGPTGLIEKGRENLVLYSNKFDEAYWSKLDGCSIVGQTATDPFGVLNNAWLISFNGTTNGRLERTISTSGIKTMSIYVRTQSGTQDVQIGFGSAELVTKTITTTWQRIEKFTPTGNLYPRLRCDDAVTLEIFAFQVELGLAATDYIESGASTGKAGLLENEPRFDYSGGATCPSLLLEPQRVQLVDQTEYLTSTSNGVIEHNNTTSPEGLQNAVLFTSNNSASSYFRSNVFAATDPTNVSVFLKYTNNQYIQVLMSGDAGHYVNFDIQNGSIGTSGAKTSNETIEDYGNGWYRVSATFTGYTGNPTARIYLSDSSSAGFGGSASAIGQSVYAYGLQAESNASYPTSYIPNHSGGSATRTADFPTTNISTDITDSTQGSVYFEFQSISATSTDVQNYITLNTSTTDNIRFGVQSAGGIFRAKKDASDLFSQGFPISDPTAVNKVAFRWGLNDWKLYLNGSEVYASTSMATFESGDLTKLENGINNNLGFLGNVRQLLVFPNKLSDNELQTLTT